MTTHPFTTELSAALASAADKPATRARLQALFDRVAGDPIYECVVAHHMADAQGDPHEELAWDLKALAAAQRCGEFDNARHTIAIDSFMPSLHLNLADVYFRLGDLEQSRAHLTLARSFESHLPDNEYGQMIRRGIERLAKELSIEGSQ